MNKVGDVFKKIINFIIKVIKFIPTVFGQICFWLLIIILALILIYILISVMAKGIADILGIDDPGLTSTTDYEILSQITTSGYDVVMPADELQDFYAYEYAVLMDLARNLEEAGTFIPTVVDEAYYDPALLSIDEWAQLCADTFVTNYRDSYASQIKGKYTRIKKDSETAKNEGKIKAKDGGSLNDVTTEVLNNLPSSNSLGITDKQREYLAETLAIQAMAESENAKPSNEKSKEEIVYKSVTSSTTGETSLVPYLVIQRAVEVYKYRFVDESMDITSNPSKDYNNIFRTTKGGGYKKGTTVDFGVGGASGETWQYISEYIRPLYANSTLNANNISLHKKNAPGSSSPLDISKPYPEDIYYGKEGGINTYNIPVKVLADRFMPKAVLLSSWYMLKQDEPTAEGETKTVDLILQEIKDIYNQACLEGETVPEANWILVKEVLTTGKTTSNANLKNIFTRKDFSTLNSLEEYAFKKNNSGNVIKTDLIYEKYDTNYDSRELSNQPQVSTPNPNPNLNQTPAQPSLLEPYNQEFGGSLRDDIIDDFELVLSHHNTVSYGFINEKQYEKAIGDFERILESTITLQDIEKTSANALKTYTIYKTNENGEYIIDCTELENDLHHNKPNGSNHNAKYHHELNSDECIAYIKNEAEHQDPYSSRASEKCFEPFIKVVFGRVKTDSRESADATGAKIKTDVSVKATAIVIIDGTTEYWYRVDEKEIEDVAGLTNDVSFMKFDRYDAQMTNFSDWDEENSMDDAEKRTYFIITDVFEAWPVEISNIDIDLNRPTSGYYSGNFDFPNDGIDRKVYASDEGGKVKVRNQIEADLRKLIENIDITDMLKDQGLEIYDANELAVVRGDKDANGEFLPEVFIPPTNAAPVAGSPALPSYYTTTGEADMVTGRYIKVKGMDAKDVAAKVQAIKNEINTKILSAMRTYAYDEHKIKWTNNGAEARRVGN